MKVKEWQGGSGLWYAANTDDLTNKKSYWWYIPRILNISLTDYVTMLIKQYKVSTVKLLNSGLLYFAWDQYSLCHKYVLDINKRLKNL